MNIEISQEKIEQILREEINKTIIKEIKRDIVYQSVDHIYRCFNEEGLSINKYVKQLLQEKIEPIVSNTITSGSILDMTKSIVIQKISNHNITYMIEQSLRSLLKNNTSTFDSFVLKFLEEDKTFIELIK